MYLEISLGHLLSEMSRRHVPEPLKVSLRDVSFSYEALDSRAVHDGV